MFAFQNKETRMVSTESTFQIGKFHTVAKKMAGDI
jgi:hypothetical protein